MANPTTKPLGNLVRLSPLQPSELPSHADLPDLDGSTGQQRPQLLTFLRTILSEGLAFSQSFQDPSLFHKTSSKPSPPSTSSVDVLVRNIPASDLTTIAWDGADVAVPRKTPTVEGGEYWVARRSYHEDRKAAGTAEWKEFEFGLRDDHTKHEEDFTPTLFDANRTLDWNTEIKNGLEKDIPGFDTITMGIYEMCHALQPPLKPRCFPILVVTANVRPETTTGPSSETDGFIAITVPVSLDPRTAPSSFYSSGRNLSTNFGPSKADKLKKSKPVFGIYAAVERVRLVTGVVDAGTSNGHVEDEARKGKEGQIEWIMATASDAKGNVPMFLQKLGIAGAVVKDVGLFLDWIRKVNPVS